MENERVLPADIISRILYESDQPRHIIPRYSRGINERSRAYIKRECQRPVSAKELEIYLKKESTININIFRYQVTYIDDENPDAGLMIINSLTLFYRKEPNGWYHSEIDLNDDEGELSFIVFRNPDQYKLGGAKPKSISKIVDSIYKPSRHDHSKRNLDVVTLYNVYRNRLNCMRISSIFAKDLVISNFNDTLSDIENVDNNRTFLVVYLYLYTQAKALKMETELLPLSDIILRDFAHIREDQFDKLFIKNIAAEIPKLKEQILSELNKLV